MLFSAKVYQRAFLNYGEALQLYVLYDYRLCQLVEVEAPMLLRENVTESKARRVSQWLQKTQCAPISYEKLMFGYTVVSMFAKEYGMSSATLKVMHRVLREKNEEDGDVSQGGTVSPAMLRHYKNVECVLTGHVQHLDATRDGSGTDEHTLRAILQVSRELADLLREKFVGKEDRIAALEEFIEQHSNDGDKHVVTTAVTASD